MKECLLVLGLFAPIIGCAMDEPDAADAEDRLVATLQLPDELITISTIAGQGRSRVEVSGESGNLYLRLDRDVDDGQSAPTPASQDARTSYVLGAVSSAVAPLAEDDDYLPVRDELTALATLAPEAAGGEPVAALAACLHRSLRVAVTGGTAFLDASTCGTQRGGSVTNECTGTKLKWRVRSAATGGVINAGSRASCVGGGIGTFFQKIRIEVVNRFGFWEGVAST